MHDVVFIIECKKIQQNFITSPDRVFAIGIKTQDFKIYKRYNKICSDLIVTVVDCKKWFDDIRG